MNPRLRVLLASIFVGGVFGAVRAAWARPEHDRNYLGHVLGGAFLGMLAGIAIAELAFPVYSDF